MLGGGENVVQFFVGLKNGFVSRISAIMDYQVYKTINCVYKRQFYTLGFKGYHFLLQDGVGDVDFDGLKVWLKQCKAWLDGTAERVDTIVLGPVVLDVMTMSVNARGVQILDKEWFCFATSSEFHCITLGCSARDVFETVEYFYHMITHLDS
jgi:hypothetical protein